MNQNIKQKLSKACEETGMKWLDALPLALMSIRSLINRGTGFSPFELIHGHQFPGPGALSVGKEVELMSSKPYFQQFEGWVSCFSTQVADAKGGPERHKANTAEFVWLKVIMPKWLNPRFSGPYRVTQRTSHAVRLEGKGDNWYHWSQCAAGKPPARTLDDIGTDVALTEEVDSEAAIRGQEEDTEDIPSADNSEAAISGPEEQDPEDIIQQMAQKLQSAGWGTSRGSRGVYFSLIRFISSTIEGKAAPPPQYQMPLLAYAEGEDEYDGSVDKDAVF
ncbi:uncharacterized protein LOC117546842 [Gymnodraco acuticeps]|uniref:Uncharacterized protein LOC117546842 n=1 Tax=Gymnodraco acuticeps TaxID=8218 RepID=A0A6P8U8E0_GYMAC|nr:uncharacterized protein LOC117546842 [Gymnodraco acuticeps]